MLHEFKLICNECGQESVLDGGSNLGGLPDGGFSVEIYQGEEIYIECLKCNNNTQFS